MAKDTEWRDKFDAMEKQATTQTDQMRIERDKLVNDKTVICKNYESQMKMLSEHIVDLNLQNERLKSGHSD